MRLFHHSAGLALCALLWALLWAACDSPLVSCDTSATAGAASSCQSMQCTGTLRDCKNGATDGCETDTAADANNCGACGNKCPTPSNGDATCVDGVCGASRCGTRYKDCNTSASDGCEVDTARDVNNCGACGTVCAGGTNATAACIQGKCQLACQGAFLDCNGDPADGCETNGASDLTSCGNCGNTCTNPGTNNVQCAAGSCISTMCTGTNQTCKAGPIDSCETDTATSVANCGTCGKQCATLPNSTPGCAASNCGIKSCNTGFANCNSVTTDGCEINLTNNLANCGTCGKACTYPNAGATCSASTCAMGSCSAGFADCNKSDTDGCEINTNTDANNCGTCGNKCAAGTSCANGLCESCFPNGPQLNVPVARLIACGWTQCYLDNFNDAFSQSKLLTQCSKARVTEACRTVGATTLQLMAQAPRSDVFFVTGDSNNVTHDANGTSWYFSGAWSQGFAPLGGGVSRNQCDVVGGPLRMCIHTLPTYMQGYRCGDQTNLQSGNTTYERIFYHHD